MNSVGPSARCAVASKHLFRRIDGSTVSIAAEAAALMWSHAQTDGASLEAGGILLGRLIAECDDVVVDLALPPSPDDRATRFRFFRARGAANLAIRAHWERSSGTRIYLGEWHSHPEDRPTPSCLDLHNWNRILSKSVFEQDSLFFIIVGRVELRLWELRTGERAPHLLQPIQGPVVNPHQIEGSGS